MSFDERRALIVALIDRIVIDPPHQPHPTVFEHARTHAPEWRSDAPYQTYER
jgi:hypothetical protein